MKALVQLILNATAAGKSMLLAANATAQKVLLSLENVTNTSDAAKPVSTAQQTALDLKVSKSGDTMTGDLILGGNQLNAATIGDSGSTLRVRLGATTNSTVTFVSGLNEVGFYLQFDQLTLRNKADDGNANFAANSVTATTLRSISTARTEGLLTCDAGISVTSGNLTVSSGGISCGPVTFSVLNATTATVGLGEYRVTDRANRRAYPDGTNWRWVADDTIIS